MTTEGKCVTIKVIVMRKLLILCSFFTITPVFILFTTIFLVFLSFEQATNGHGISLFHVHQNVAYAALPDDLNVVSGSVGIADVRVGKVLNFLESYNSPLSTYASIIVETADKYSLDYRWIPAIAMQESGGCQKVIGDSKNCFGFGIHGGKVKKFSSYEDGIEAVGKYLAKNKQSGFDTIDKLGSIYNPSNFNDWKGKVNLFLTQM